MTLSYFDDAKAVETKRRASCRNCDFDRGMFKKGMRRVVISGGLGKGARHVSLCSGCADWEAARLMALAYTIRKAARDCA